MKLILKSMKTDPWGNLDFGFGFGFESRKWLNIRG